MAGCSVQFFWTFVIFIIMLLISGFYCIIVTRNLMRALIGLELLTKAVTLFLILAGFAIDQIAIAQAMVITLIVIEVVIIAVAAGVILNVYDHNESLNITKLRNLKG